MTLFFARRPLQGAPARPPPARGTAERIRLRAAVVALAALTALAMVALLGACAQNYAEGQRLEGLQRWEEAAIAYRLAVIDAPDNPEFRDALQRANKVVARENMEHYRVYLARKEFGKAYQRLLDAARQDPDYPPVREEEAKWMRVLVAGQVTFDFSSSLAGVSQADQIRLLVRINTPNPGETLDAEIDLDTGAFFAEGLLYDRPNELLPAYTLHAIGAELIFGRTQTKQFTSREFRRFINLRTPLLEGVTGNLTPNGSGELTPVAEHRAGLAAAQAEGEAEAVVPEPNPRYRLRFAPEGIEVTAPEQRNDFTPRFLYLNRKDRRLFVDFGRYEARLEPGDKRWSLRRMTGPGNDHFNTLARNVALLPYFFYREGVYAYVSPGKGQN